MLYIGIKCVIYGYSCAHVLCHIPTGDVVKNYHSVCSQVIDRKYLESQWAPRSMKRFGSGPFVSLS